MYYVKSQTLKVARDYWYTFPLTFFSIIYSLSGLICEKSQSNKYLPQFYKERRESECLEKAKAMSIAQVSTWFLLSKSTPYPLQLAAPALILILNHWHLFFLLRDVWTRRKWTCYNWSLQNFTQYHCYNIKSVFLRNKTCVYILLDDLPSFMYSSDFLFAFSRLNFLIRVNTLGFSIGIKYESRHTWKIELLKKCY